jgi:hypothetical protein
MRRVVLKEAHTPYTLAIEEEALTREPFILERDGKSVAVVIPITEYEAFRAWRFGYVPVYVQQVEEQPRVYKLPHRKVAR